MVVERLGAELAQEVVVLGRGGRDHAGAAGEGELDRDVADAARAAGQEQVLAAAQPEQLEALVRDQRRQRQRRGLLEGQPLGHVGEEALRARS